MTEQQAQRLARLRLEVEKWQVTDPYAKYWDTTFLLEIIDEKNRRIHDLQSDRRWGNDPVSGRV